MNFASEKTDQKQWANYSRGHRSAVTGLRKKKGNLSLK